MSNAAPCPKWVAKIDRLSALPPWREVVVSAGIALLLWLLPAAAMLATLLVTDDLTLSPALVANNAIALLWLALLALALAALLRPLRLRLRESVRAAWSTAPSGKHRWRRLRTRLLIAGAWVAVLFSVLLVGQLWPDHIAPEIERRLAADVAYPEHDNAHFILAGFDARADEAPEALGRQRLTHYLKVHAERHDGRRVSYELPPDLAARKLEFEFGTWDQCLQRSEADCVPEVLKARAEIEQAARTHAVYLQRYRDMLAKSHYAGPSKPDIEWPLPPFSGIAPITRLHRALAVLAIDDGREEAGLQAIFAALRLHRIALHEGNTLLEKIVALVAIRNEARLLAQVLAWRPQTAKRRQAEIALVLRDIEPADLDFSVALEQEYRATGTLFGRLGTPGQNAEVDLVGEQFILAKPLYLRGETLRLITAQHDAALARLKRPSADVLERQRAAQQAFDDQLAAEAGLPLLWNGIGKALLGLGPPNYAQYVARAYDVAALLRAARAQARATAEGWPAHRLAALLNDPAYAHPLNGKPPQWDATKQVLGIAQVSTTGAAGAYSLPMTAF